MSSPRARSGGRRSATRAFGNSESEESTSVRVSPPPSRSRSPSLSSRSPSESSESRLRQAVLLLLHGRPRRVLLLGSIGTARAAAAAACGRGCGGLLSHGPQTESVPFRGKFPAHSESRSSRLISPQSCSSAGRLLLRLRSTGSAASVDASSVAVLRASSVRVSPPPSLSPNIVLVTQRHDDS